MRGKTPFFVGSVHRHATHPHLLLGDVTALNTQLMPAYLDWLRAPSQEIALLPDWERKLTRMVETSVEQNIVHLAGMPTWMRHFAHRVLAHTGASTLRDVWPNLLALTVGGVNPQPYLPELRRLIVGNKTGDPLHVREVFNATEGFVAMQMGEDDDLTLLPNGGIFYEFVERRAAAAGDFARAMPLAGVEANVDYALLLTSYNGLWRYLMGDCVRFTATPALGKLYRLVFAGRLSESLNIASEELLVENADAALAKVCRAHGVNLVDYTATALLNANLEADAENARHLWLVEVDAPGALSSAQFARALDESLCADLYDYNKIRTGGTHGSFGLAAPLVLLVPPGTFARWLQTVRGNALGAQSKVARLSSDPRHVRGVLATLPPEVVDAWRSTLSPGQLSALATARPAWSTSGR